MKWLPIHKRTDQEYPVISDAERLKNWSRPPYSTNFRFEPIEETPKPEAIKPAQPKKEIPTSEEEKGLDQPNG